MDFLKEQAQKAMHKDQSGQPGQQPGGGGGGLNFSDGIQFSDIKALASGNAGVNLKDGLDISDLKGLAAAFSKTQANPNANSNDPNHVIQQLGGPQQAGGAMDKLMGVFKQNTGHDFQAGNSEHESALGTIAQQVTGTNIPPSMLGQLAKMKMGGMI